MTNIDPRIDCITLINTFSVKPEKQVELIETLVEITQKVMRHLDGFISSSIHRGMDGDRVANYSQWRSLEHFQAALTNPVAREHMMKAARLADKIDPHIYEVESSFDRGETVHLFGPEARI